MRPWLISASKGRSAGSRWQQQLGRKFDVPVIYLIDETEEDLLQQAQATQPYGYVLRTSDARQLHLSIRTALAMHEEARWRRTRESRLYGTINDLQRRTRIMDTILNSTRDGIVAADGAGRILFVQFTGGGQLSARLRTSRRVNCMTPLNDRSKYGLFELDGETYLPTDESPLVCALRGKATDDKEMFVRNAHQPEGIYVNVTGRTLWSDDQKDIEGGIVFFRDVTREKEAEADLQRTVAESRKIRPNSLKPFLRAWTPALSFLVRSTNCSCRTRRAWN